METLIQAPHLSTERPYIPGVLRSETCLHTKDLALSMFHYTEGTLKFYHSDLLHDVRALAIAKPGECYLHVIKQAGTWIFPLFACASPCSNADWSIPDDLSIIKEYLGINEPNRKMFVIRITGTNPIYPTHIEAEVYPVSRKEVWDLLLLDQTIPTAS